MAWARGQQLLAVGTTKGNLLLYNQAYLDTPIMGIYTRAVTCAAWSSAALLATGAADKQASPNPSLCYSNKA